MLIELAACSSSAEPFTGRLIHGEGENVWGSFMPFVVLFYTLIASLHAIGEPKVKQDISLAAENNNTPLTMLL